jgi:radical SAM superfamily enzyme YgiQ (UPF0313 family)
MKICIAQFEGIDNTPALPLAAGLLIAAARRDDLIRSNVTFEIIVPRLPLKNISNEFNNCNLAGFSLYPWNTAYSLSVIASLPKEHPIIVGGPSIPKREKSILAFMKENPSIDFIMLGEGEQNFPAFVTAFMNQQDLSTIPSLVYRKGSEIIISSPASRVEDFRLTASPYLDGTFDALLNKYPGFFQMGMLETNRGCPFLCTFCDWSITRQVMEIPLERIYKEIDWLASKNFYNFCIIDANFGIRRRDPLISQYLANCKNQTGYPSFCYFYLTKNNHERNWNTIQTFHQAGINCTVGLAVQDFDDDVLKAVKRDNIQSSESNQLREMCAKRDIPTRNELILGLPKQTYQSFVNTLMKAIPPYPNHDFVLFLCRLLDNTELANPEEKLKNKIETRRCLWVSPKGRAFGVIDEYQEIIVSTIDLPIADWKKTYRFAYLVSMAYNKNLMRVIFRSVRDLWNLSLQAYIEHILESMKESHPDSALGTLWRIQEKYLHSIDQNKAYQLPYFSEEDRPWEVDEALAISVLLNPDQFYQELLTCSLDFLPESKHSQLEELIAFQALCIPRRQAPISPDFSWDWQTYKIENTLFKRFSQYTFEQPSYSCLPEQQFVSTFLNLLQSRSITTQQTPEIMAIASSP